MRLPRPGLLPALRHAEAGRAVVEAQAAAGTARLALLATPESPPTRAWPSTPSGRGASRE